MENEPYPIWVHVVTGLMIFGCLYKFFEIFFKKSDEEQAAVEESKEQDNEDETEADAEVEIKADAEVDELERLRAIKQELIANAEELGITASAALD